MKSDEGIGIHDGYKAIGYRARVRDGEFGYRECEWYSERFRVPHLSRIE